MVGSFLDHFEVHAPGSFGIERQVELIVPAHFVPCLAHLKVAFGGSGMSFGDVGGMGGQLVSHYPFAYVVLIGQGQVFFRRDIAKHRSPIQPIIAAPIAEVMWSYPAPMSLTSGPSV